MNNARFYDRDANVSRAVKLLMLLPFELQSIIADGIALMAEQEFRANELLRELKSLGTDKVLAIYKSKQRKRDYDKNPAMHKAMNYLMVLSDENRIWLSHKIVGLVAHLKEYLQTCRVYSALPTRQAVGTLTNTYTQQGAEEVRRYLKAVEADFIRQGLRKATPIQAVSVMELPDEIILEHDIGLRIRTERPQ